MHLSDNGNALSLDVWGSNHVLQPSQQVHLIISHFSGGGGPYKRGGTCKYEYNLCRYYYYKFRAPPLFLLPPFYTLKHLCNPPPPSCRRRCQYPCFVACYGICHPAAAAALLLSCCHQRHQAAVTNAAKLPPPPSPSPLPMPLLCRALPQLPPAAAALPLRCH